MFVRGLRVLAKTASGTKLRPPLRCLSTESHRAPAFLQDCILRRPDTDVDIPNVTLTEYMWASIENWMEKPATVCNATGRTYTYADIYKRSINFAKALRARLGLQPGETVAIVLPNVPEYPIALLGAIEAGIVATTVNPIYTTEEISKQLVDANAKAIITLCEYFGRTRDATNIAKLSIPIMTIKAEQADTTPVGAIDFLELCTQEINFDVKLHPGSPDDVIIMPYSSGTTGLPKGVELTHKNIVANMCQNHVISTLVNTPRGDEQDILPVVLPMFHIYGMTVNTLKGMTLGCKLITLPKFTPDIYANMLIKQKPHHLILVPPIVIFLAAHPSITMSHLDSVVTITSGAAPLGTSDAERLFNKMGREITTLQGYGMTETSPAVCATPPEMWRDCLGSIGLVMPNTECKVVGIDNPRGAALGPNEPGELLVRGPQVMPRYHNNPKATEEVFVDGWLRTGDLVYYDERQIIWITDRLKELIKVKGFQVAPAELEAIIRDHPQVADAAVIGVPHPIFGEVPRAFVVGKSGQTVDCDAVKEHVAKKVASYKRLEGGVTVLDSIPKTASGKIMRRTLKTQYAT